MKTFFSSPVRVTMLVIGSIILWHIGLWAGYTFLEGFPAELCAKIQGFSITPFFMEFSFIVFGFMVVMLINRLRQKWDGEELVYLEVVDDVDAELPEGSKTVVLPKRVENEDPFRVTVAAIEGAIEIKDFALAKELLLEFSTNELNKPEVQSLQKRIS